MKWRSALIGTLTLIAVRRVRERLGEPANRLQSDLHWAATVTVDMTNSNDFQPAAITVVRGTTVRWVNTGVMPHTVTDDPSKAAKPSDAALPSGAQAWNSGQLNGGQSFRMRSTRRATTPTSVFPTSRWAWLATLW